MDHDYFNSRIRSANTDYLLIKEWINFENKRVLDIGCGGGGKAVYWIQVGADQVFGLDINLGNAFYPTIGTDNNRLGKNLNPIFVQADATNIPFTAETFDIITIHDVMEHLSSPMDVLRECHRVLRRSGRISIVSPHYYGLSGNHLWNYFNNRILRYLHLHLVIPKVILHAMINNIGDYKGFSKSQIEFEWNQFCELNRLHLADLETGVEQYFSLLHWSLRFPESKYIYNVLKKFPLLQEYFSYGVVAVAEKT